MDYEKSLKLTKHYRELSDEEIRELLRAGQDSFEKDAYDILLMEAKGRKLDDVAAVSTETGKPLEELTRGEILALFMSAQTMEKNSYNALCAEAFRRNICRDDVERFYKEKIEARSKDTREEKATEVPVVSNPLPLITIENPEDAQPFFKALAEAGIACNIQIIVEEEDYEKANHAISRLQPENK